MTTERDKVVVRKGFMCAVDHDVHMEDDSKGTRIFGSEEILRENKVCIEGCGLVEVEVRVVRRVDGSDHRA